MIRAALWCLALWALVPLPGCTDRRGPPPNVILISIDSLRYDHLGCYGYPLPTSPAIDSLAAQGARFSRVHSSSTWTLPAHVSLFTGLPDEVHEVVHDYVALDRDRVMLAECFRDAGYRTGGFYAGPYLHRSFGFDQGFEVYESCGVPTFSDLEQPGMGPDEEQALWEQVDLNVRDETTAVATGDHAEKFLDADDGRPFFLFVHHWDVHYDYLAPQELVDCFAPEGAIPFDTRGLMGARTSAEPLDPGQLAYLLASYDAEIRFVDIQIGRLLESLERRGLLENTIICLISDHGDEFFEHGVTGHRRNLHEETLRIPWIVAGPGVPAGRVIDRHARIVDVMPTLLDLAGLDEVADVYGVSLCPLLAGDDPEVLRDLPLVAELVGIVGADRFEKRVAVGRGGYKLLRTSRHEFDGTRANDFSGAELFVLEERVYNLDDDPGERVDLAGSSPEVRFALQDLLLRVMTGLRARWESISHRGSRAPHELDPDVIRMLREIGYLGDRGPASGLRRKE